jgi:TATA-box binding protein (TBP) (component of TFIID and TFIIIB)
MTPGIKSYRSYSNSDLTFSDRTNAIDSKAYKGKSNESDLELREKTRQSKKKVGKTREIKSRKKTQYGNKSHQASSISSSEEEDLESEKEEISSSESETNSSDSGSSSDSDGKKKKDEKKSLKYKIGPTSSKWNKKNNPLLNPQFGYVTYPFRIDEKSLNEALQIERLPKNLSISTMTMTCGIGTKINRKNVAYYMSLGDKTGMDNIRFGSNPGYQRSVRPKKKPRPMKKTQAGPEKQKQRFYNQATVEIDPKSGNNKINVKEFNNGSLQMTGVKSKADFISIMKTLLRELAKVKGVLRNGTIRPKPFVQNPENMHVHNIKVDLINANFKARCEFDRIKLHRRMLKDGFRATYQPCMHSPVNIKYYFPTNELDKNGKKIKKKVTIFVFESGAFIITGGGSIEQTRGTYKFIVDKINQYGHEVVLIKTDKILARSQKLQKFLEKLPDPFKGKRLNLP